MNIKNKIFATALSTLIVGTSCYAKPLNIEDRYWNDFIKSKQGIVQYVSELSNTDAKAATWFLTTGGKDGFSQRQATNEEEILLKGAMKKIAVSAKQAINNGKNIEDWVQIDTLSPQGHFNMQMLYGEINSLSKGIANLWQGIGTVRKEQKAIASRIDSLKNDINDLKSSISKLEGGFDKTEEKISKLEADNKNFKKERESFQDIVNEYDKRITAQNEAHQIRLKEIDIDSEKKRAEQKLSDKKMIADFAERMKKTFSIFDDQPKNISIEKAEEMKADRLKEADHQDFKKQLDADHQAKEEQKRQDRLLQEKKNTEAYKARISSLGIKSKDDQEFLLCYLELNWESAFNTRLEKILKAQEKTLKEEALAKAKEEEKKQRIELYNNKIDLLGLQEKTYKKILLGLIEVNLIKEYDEAVKWMVEANERAKLATAA